MLALQVIHSVLYNATLKSNVYCSCKTSYNLGLIISDKERVSKNYYIIIDHTPYDNNYY